MELTTSPSHLLAIPITIAVTIVFLLLLLRIQQSRRLPPGPMGVPLLGCLPFTDPNLHLYFTGLAETYGPILSLRQGTKLQVVISSPKLAMEVFKTQDAVFANHALPSLVYRITGTFGILAAPYGPYWRIVRKAAVHEVLSTSVINSFEPLRTKEMHRMLGRLESSVGSAIIFRDTVFSFLINTLFGMTWKDALEEKEKSNVLNRKELLEVFNVIAKTMAFFNIADFIPLLAPFDLHGLSRKVASLSKRLDVVLDSIITQKLASTSSESNQEEGPKDFLHILLDLAEKKDSEVPLEMIHVKIMIFEMLFAGSEPTLTTMEWVMTKLMQHPEVMAKAQEELDLVVGRDCVVEESHIPKLEYLAAVVKETMRVNPTLALLLPRFPSETCKVGGYTIPKGATIFVNVWAIHRDPSMWEKPLEFRPERFLESKDRWKFQGKSFEFMPFGGGKRICAGANLAERVLMYTLGSLVHKFRWELPQGTVAVNDDGEFGIALRKKDPLVVVPFTR